MGGSAAYLPTDGTNVPDFMVSSGDLVPEMNVLYGLRCEGGFTHLMRFEAASAESPISLAELVRTALGDFGRPSDRNGDGGRIGWTGGRRSSPLSRRGSRSERAPFQYPEVRILAVVLHRTALLAIAGPGFRGSRRFRMRRRWLHCCGRWEPKHGHWDIFMPRHFPIVPCKKGEHRSEIHGHALYSKRKLCKAYFTC